MKVLMVEPGKSPYAAEIESGLKSLQAAVGGDIQAVYPYRNGYIQHTATSSRIALLI